MDNSYKNYFNNNFEPKSHEPEALKVDGLDEMFKMIGVLGALGGVLSALGVDDEPAKEETPEEVSEETPSINPGITVLAKFYWETYQAFIKVGFTDKQAFKLLNHTISQCSNCAE